MSHAVEHTIDAKDKIIGRLASEIAMILMGKDKTGYQPQNVAPVRIRIYNTDQMRVTGNKLKAKKYYRHSGVIGNLKEETLEQRMKRDSRQALKHALAGMLPKNKLRARRLKNVILYKGPIPTS